MMIDDDDDLVIITLTIIIILLQLFAQEAIFFNFRFELCTSFTY